ncbi:MAG: hypothetical protein MJH11_20360 [Lentisphaeria bacterium]|nr:hypothetical protein [Lentisphaeria bacterium]NQY67296.1 hypothetical protein [Flavobacteriales bacterium]
MTELTSPGLMVRTADLMHSILKRAKKYWYITAVIFMVLASPIIFMSHRAIKLHSALTQLKKDNQYMQGWDSVSIVWWVEDDFYDNLELSEINSVKWHKSLFLNRIVGFSSDGELRDISALKGLSFKFIELQNEMDDENTVSDISALKGMSLEWLNLSWTQVSDISALKGMQLDDLILCDTMVNDISPLKGMPLTSLNLGGTPVVDISSLRGMPLEWLMLPKGARDIEFLKSIKTLVKVDGKDVKTFWEGYEKAKIKLSIQQLKKDNPQVENWDNIHYKYYYEENLYIVKLPIPKLKNINALKGFPIVFLSLKDTQVSNLTALQGMPLTVLDLYYTNVSDISILKSLPLTNLHLDGCYIQDISVLKELPIKVLHLPISVNDIEFLRSIKTLTKINGKDAEEFWEEYQKSKKSREQ